MTTSAGPYDSTAAWRPPLRISDPGDLLAAIPAMLGFRPEHSMVLLCLGGGSGSALGAVLRHDLVADPGAPKSVAREMVAVFEQFAIVSAREGAASVIAVFVDENTACAVCERCTGPHEGASHCAALRHTPLHAALVARLDEALRARGCSLIGAHVTPAIATGHPWWSLLDDPRRGLVPDPDTSPVTTAHVFEGRQIRASRSDLADLLAGDHTDRRDVAGALPEVRAASGQRSGPRSGRGASVRKKLEFVLFEIESLASGEEPSAREFAALALALEYRRVRDAVMGLAVGDSGAAAEALWLAMTRVLPHPERADAATLLGFSAYVRGDGPLAGIAFEAALAADPEHRLAWLLDSALQGGIRPDAMRELALGGYEQAAELGVVLPPPTMPRR
ncbi:DUF4192 domain-containing protein [Aldersonia sp. NBC_00410]|uniref:DUF4192 domain-containing protein n=1 Tax=Aldersonia sp. NBC_00410 TaxID=2975954 RepID=UPI002252116C|nr:DUF4192 domain-containing protein [Aldersonia sp. NBC_00410]MCX5042586.1 DUF4192 domain-containing protein [Aldersonia sp. NBC_00410]